MISSLKTLDLFNITNSLSALTAAFRELEADKFTKILSYAEAVAVRCHITGNPGHQEAIYNLSRGAWLGKQAAKIWQIPPD